jgi:hypothetical protein
LLGGVDARSGEPPCGLTEPEGDKARRSTGLPRPRRRAGIARDARPTPKRRPDAFTGLFTWRHYSVVKELLRGMRRPEAGSSLWDAFPIPLRRAEARSRDPSRSVVSPSSARGPVRRPSSGLVILRTRRGPVKPGARISKGLRRHWPLS